MSKGEIVYGWWVPTTFCHRNLPPVAGRLPGRESEQGRPTLHKSFSLVVRLSVLSA